MTVTNVGDVDVELILSHNENIDKDSIWVTFDHSNYNIPVDGHVDITFTAEITEISNMKFTFVESLIETGIVMQIKDGRLYFVGKNLI